MALLAAHSGVCARIWETAAELLLGACCRVCQAPGLACCGECRETLLIRDAHATTRKGLDFPVRAAHPYRPNIAPLIIAFKDEGAWSLSGLLAQLLSHAVAAHDLSDVTLVPMPSHPQKVRSRGIDHAATLTRRCSRLTQLPWVPALSRLPGNSQRGADRRVRVMLGAADFRVRSRPQRALLVDDVITTGATLKAAAQALRLHGVQVVAAAVIGDANRLTES